MFTINIEKECGCFNKSNLTNNIQIDSKDEALIKAQEVTRHMNTKFCQKHEFVLFENGETFSIRVDERAKAHSGCCGGGHCS